METDAPPDAVHGIIKSLFSTHTVFDLLCYIFLKKIQFLPIGSSGQLLQ